MVLNNRWAQKMTPAYPHPGDSTAVPLNLKYRLGKLKGMGLLSGIWLDCGCANGGYTEALIDYGAERAIGIDPDPNRVAEAKRRQTHLSKTEYHTLVDRFPFPDASFDGVLLNEVLEHVDDEMATLREIRRVLQPTGHLAVMSPNRWFPFEGHGARILGHDFGFPFPFLPWLPRRLALRFMTARNYWPYELRSIVKRAGFEIVLTGNILPVLEQYPWFPKMLIHFYQQSIPILEKTPLRRFGVSTLVVGRPA